MKIHPKLKTIWEIVRDTFINWNDSDPFRLSAVVAYYAVFSLPGLLLVVVTVTGYFVGEAVVKEEINQQAGELIGRQGAEQLQTMVQNAYESQSSGFATVAGIGILLFAATNLFYHLKISLNRIWGVEARLEKAWLQLIKDRLFSFGLVLAIGFLLLVSLVITSLIAAFSGIISDIFGAGSTYIYEIINEVVSLFIITLLFAAIFKVLPDIQIKWKDVLIGSVITAVLFSIGKMLIGFYLGQTDPGSTYGAAGSIVLILIWFSYSSLIFFLGAEFTQVYARKFGKPIEPEEFAEWTEKKKSDFPEGRDEAVDQKQQPARASEGG